MAANTTIQPHALVRGVVPNQCATCGERVMDLRGEVDPIHGQTPATCEACGRQTPPMRTVCDDCRAALAERAAREREERLAGYTGQSNDRQSVADFDDDEDDDRRGRRAPDMSPEAVAARAEAKARLAEAIRYIADYRGSWGLILDLRADRRWGSKHFRLSERQVDVILRAKERDAERAASAAAAPRHPQYDEALAVIREAGAYPNASEFIVSLAMQVAAGRTLSDRQVEAALRNRQQPAAPSASREPAAEGVYRREDTIYRVQWNRGKTHRYAMRLVLDEGATSGRWEYANGIVYTLREDERLSLDEAKEFGRRTGVCCVCGAELTNPQSIEAGIGPICGSRV